MPNPYHDPQHDALDAFFAEVHRITEETHAPRCLHCGEPVLPDEPQEEGRLVTTEGTEPIVQHLACAVRAVIGSVAHLEHRCSCYVPGATCGDPPGLSRRESAEFALRVWQAQQEADHG